MNDDLLEFATYSADKRLPVDIRMGIGRFVREEAYRRGLVHPVTSLYGDDLVKFVKEVIDHDLSPV